MTEQAGTDRQEIRKLSLPDDHPTRGLWSGLSAVEPYPDKVVAVPKQIPGTSFFPGGSGLWRESTDRIPQFPVGGVMVLGQDFDTYAGVTIQAWRHAKCYS